MAPRTAPPAVRLWSAALVALLLVISSVPFPTFAQTEQNYVDDATGDIRTFDPARPVNARFVNRSPHRVDVYLDDGRFGTHALTIGAGAKAALSGVAIGSSYWTTKHGTKEQLFGPEPDGVGEGSELRQLRFEVGKPDQTFEVPALASPSDDPCLDRFPACEAEARRGSCRTHPGWMTVHCCQSCDPIIGSAGLTDPAIRCTRDRLNTTEPAWGPGDLDRLFTSWATESKFARFSPTVHSSPSGAHGGAVGPWVMTFDNFLTDKESDDLAEGGRRMGFQRSTDQGKMNKLGEREKWVSQSRTSSNAWCIGQCESLPGVVSATSKIEEVTGIDRRNYESFQILQYEEGQFYRSHHDSSPGSRDQPAGPRILTFFLYMSDVEEGGETHFTDLGLSIAPKKGRALVWPSVTDKDPSFWDNRMHHEAKEVIRGKKMAANHWIHLYDYKTPNIWGCSGSFA
mmetsp:Transcript_8252/g.17457  ORF Transcript_8252/g.17457 Transcript_8252/m.17457 type:complete len:456 (-) Transcript_8252:242-1609(-)|eukprot:CAMPEP_0183298260 /NCGR_PEP_ID=MMETSP0160_2-20130417/5333_1 /TAXON_ID=2839 ORGANISM="Odontella Sinensis, Strain Grunow 1884" /NCGR_SAMPLE_ID=MMETSP0160_2 /ASSEMBLY_ACC=CAM_ASM_000250 /LENGTH=455 /DNA_ID=CAMNT_0025460263 /DNA_START=131 /DNA_END=1498 /DNA_ORIENTATION=+